VRPRKLLLNRKEIVRLIGAVDRQGYTIVPVSMYWNRGKAKLEIGTAKGKKQHDKRATEKDRDWQREKERVLRKS
jgi:SsrA-binding protein